MSQFYHALNSDTYLPSSIDNISQAKSQENDVFHNRLNAKIARAKYFVNDLKLNLNT